MTKLRVFKDGTVWVARWDMVSLDFPTLDFPTFEAALKHALMWRETYFKMYRR